MKKSVLIAVLSLSLMAQIAAQSATSNTVRQRTATTSKPQKETATPKPVETQKPTETQKSKTTTTTTSPAPKPKTSPAPAGLADVNKTFDALLEGIRHADVKAVTSVYLNSPRLVLFNNNGTVTKGWEQMRKNRESSYPDLKDVKLECRDRSTRMLGLSGAVVTCLWTQSQTYKGTPETASGRMTVVFQRIGKEWKAVHLHTSPDREDPTRVPPSEQASPSASPKPE
jgi:ketosteroid isomerase-like protein